MTICTIEGCDRPSYCKSLCKAHYTRFLRGTDLLKPFAKTPTYYAPGTLCSVSNCNRAVESLGLCPVHYKRKKIGKSLDTPINSIHAPYKLDDICLAQNCNEKAKLKGFCKFHYYRYKTGRDLTTPKQPPALLIGGRRLVSGGYITLRVPECTAGAMKVPGKNRWEMYEHRYVIQQRIGRPLLRSESVHHKDGNRANNKLDNLELRSGAHGMGIRIEDGALAHIAYLERYVGLDLADRAFLARLRDKATLGLLGEITHAELTPKRRKAA